jgi:hypothetical protein
METFVAQISQSVTALSLRSLSQSLQLPVCTLHEAHTSSDQSGAQWASTLFDSPPRCFPSVSCTALRHTHPHAARSVGSSCACPFWTPPLTFFRQLFFLVFPLPCSPCSDHVPQHALQSGEPQRRHAHTHTIALFVAAAPREEGHDQHARAFRSRVPSCCGLSPRGSRCVLVGHTGFSPGAPPPWGRLPRQTLTTSSRSTS